MTGLTNQTSRAERGTDGAEERSPSIAEWEFEIPREPLTERCGIAPVAALKPPGHYLDGPWSYRAPSWAEIALPESDRDAPLSPGVERPSDFEFWLRIVAAAAGDAAWRPLGDRTEQPLRDCDLLDWLAVEMQRSGAIVAEGIEAIAAALQEGDRCSALAFQFPPTSPETASASDRIERSNVRVLFEPAERLPPALDPWLFASELEEGDFFYVSQAIREAIPGSRHWLEPGTPECRFMEGWGSIRSSAEPASELRPGCWILSLRSRGGAESRAAGFEFWVRRLVDLRPAPQAIAARPETKFDGEEVEG